MDQVEDEVTKIEVLECGRTLHPGSFACQWRECVAGSSSRFIEQVERVCWPVDFALAKGEGRAQISKLSEHLSTAIAIGNRLIFSNRSLD